MIRSSSVIFLCTQKEERKEEDQKEDCVVFAFSG
jgi:hypothetical protein